MVTPSSGAISMLDMRSEITRGSGSISMSEVQSHYGGTGPISFNELYRCEGFFINPGERAAGKSDVVIGYERTSFTLGSVSPDEVSGRIQFATNSFLSQFTSLSSLSASTTIIIDNNTSTDAPVGSSITAGFRANNITRVGLNGIGYTSFVSSTDSRLDVTNSVIMPGPPNTDVPALIKF